MKLTKASTETRALRADLHRRIPEVLMMFQSGEFSDVARQIDRCRAAVNRCMSRATASGEMDELLEVMPRLVVIQAVASTLAETREGNLEEALYYLERGLFELLNHFCSHANVLAYDRCPEVRSLQRAYEMVRRHLGPILDEGPVERPTADQLRMLRADLLECTRLTSKIALCETLQRAEADRRHSDAALLRERLRFDVT